MKRIAVITGTRADYGLLYWTLKRLQEDEDFHLDIIATCMHLSEKFGGTWREIESDGFKISRRVDLGDLADSTESVLEQVSKGIPEFYKAFSDLDTELVIILGDRYEMLAAAQAAMFADIPIAHIHGGEITEGAFDDMIRHSITKMSSYHFTSTDEYTQRVVQMGEKPERVLNVGALGLENIKQSDFMSKEELSKNLGFDFRERNLLVTYHPVTAAKEEAISDLLKALSEFPDVGLCITMPNSDPGHQKIFDLLEDFQHKNSNVYLTSSLGFKRYLSAMAFCNGLVGNSSSGVIEAPFMGVPTLNIGERQKGRLRAESVIDVEASYEDIKSGISRILELRSEQSFLYGNGESSEKILNYLKSTEFTVKKGFNDL